MIHFIHRDIKPENYLIGNGSKNQDQIYLIDFGLAKRYRDPKTGNHIKFKMGKGSIGTSRYSSLNSSLNYEQSRRDDLEGLGFVLCYLLLKGRLPWMSIKTDSWR